MRIIIIVLCVMVLFSSCGEVEKSELSKTSNNITSEKVKYKSISPEEAKKTLETEKDVVLLDVRTVEEYTEKHIPGSVLVPVEVIESEVEAKIKDKNSKILVYCRSGRRSKIAIDSMTKLGYTNLYDLGGINDWPYETQSGEPK